MNSTYSISKSDVKQLAQQIESLAREVVSRVDNGGDVLSVSNELARNNVTFVFTLGEFFALEQTSTPSNVKVKKSNPNYHNLRDSHGRFVRKI